MKIFDGFEEKLKEDKFESKEYGTSVKVTLFKGLLCVVGIYILGAMKDQADAERSVYTTKIAQDRATNTVLKAEMEKKMYKDKVKAAMEAGVEE